MRVSDCSSQTQVDKCGLDLTLDSQIELLCNKLT